MKRNLSTLDRDIGQSWSRILMEAFRDGIDCDIIQGGLLTAGVAQGIEVVSDTQNYVIGTRRVTADGRVFRYSKSNGICWTGRANKFDVDIDNDGFDFNLLGATSAVGSSSITMAAATHPEFTTDQLVGAYVLISDQDSGETQDKMVQNRICTGNTASLANAALTFTISEPLTRQVTAATYAFIMPSPYSGIAFSASVYGASYAGLAATYVSAAGKYFWLQTWGPCWIAAQGNVGTENSRREVVFREDGSLDLHEYGVDLLTGAQHAGFIIDNNDGANGGTFFMLQITP